MQRLEAAALHATDRASVADCVEGCKLLDVIEGGRVVGAVAVRIEGAHATITAAASQGLMTYAELDVIERALHRLGVRHIGLYTKRPGLVRQLTAHGYRIHECELFKELPSGKEVIQ